MKDTINMFNPMIIRSENDYDPITKSYRFDVEINIINPRLNEPYIHEINGVRTRLFPHDARNRNFTYDSALTVDLDIKYRVAGADSAVSNMLTDITIGKIPVMVRSSACLLSTTGNDSAECSMDPGGYFIINGSEKVCIAQERTIENKPLCFDVSKSNSKYSHTIDIKSVPHEKCISPRQFGIMISKTNNGFGNPMYAQISRVRQHIPLFILYRAYGIENDRDICQYIVDTTAGDTPGSRALLASLRASIVDATEIRTREEAIEYISRYAMFTPPKKSYKPPAPDQPAPDPAELEQTTIDNSTAKRRFVESVLENEILPHCRDAMHKTRFIGYMAHRVMMVQNGVLPHDDRDSYLNKRLDTTGVLMNNLFRNYYNKLTKDMQKQIVYEINNGSWKSTDSYASIVNRTNIYKIIKTSTIENGMRRALSTGDFGTRNGSDKVGVAQVLNRLNYMSLLSHLRRVNTPIDKSGKLVAPRKLHSTTWGVLCPTESPEGGSVGVVKNLSSMSMITMPSSSAMLYDVMVRAITPLNRSVDLNLYHRDYKVFCNGEWIGTTDSPTDLYHQAKTWKTAGVINLYTSVTIDVASKELHVCNDGGRLVRPLFIVDRSTNRLVVDDLANDTSSPFSYDDPCEWDDYLFPTRWGKSMVEYVDVEEQHNSMLLMRRSDMKPGIRYTHCEIHPSTIFGVLASCIPFPDHNQSPRNTYQCAMGKQAMGMYSTRHTERMDKTGYVMSYPARPLVDTRLSNTLKLQNMPCGSQLVVAIMSYTGYNQEDSVLLNQSAIDRGLFQTTVLHTEKDEDINTHGEEEIRGKPDKSRTQGIKFGNYDKVDSNGIVPENTKLDKGDIIMAKVATIKENRNDNTKVIKYRDQSNIFRSGDNCYVDKVITGRNGDGYRFCKMRIRDVRRIGIGDKFSSRHGQKGTAGNILPEADMPYTRSGIKPDIIINPHAIPSRMTIAQLKETILGKVLLEMGMFGDGTPFGELTVDDIRKKLVDVGYESNGNELMYNGMTGEQLESSIFIGPVYYQRLKHMVEDKNHSRSVGPMMNLTRQPAEGRSRDGGLRIGEMERDCIASHGVARFCRERLYDSSDAYSVHVCKSCGIIARFNQQYNIHHCATCDNKTDFSYVEIPYACKLMFQELNTMNVSPRLILDNT
jgi:DNA-directed RNA polymerase II subunit RPB2